MTDKPRLTTRQLTEVIQGRAMTYNEMLDQIKIQFPERYITRSILRERICGMVASPHVQIVRGSNTYKLVSVSECYFRLSERQAENRAPKRAPKKPTADDIERNNCAMMSQLNQLLNTVRQEARP